MMYFYKIGDCVLGSDQRAAQYEYTQNGEFRSLIFQDNATVSVIKPGDTYEHDNN